MRRLSYCRRVAYAGFSRGGYAAAAMASRVGRATHAMVYHSLVLKQQVGNLGLTLNLMAK